MTEEKPKCDVDDLLCQMQILSHLRGMKSVLGDEKFKTGFPEFEGLSERVTERISTQETSLKEALERCGLSEPEEVEIPITASAVYEPETTEEE